MDSTEHNDALVGPTSVPKSVELGCIVHLLAIFDDAEQMGT